MKRGLTWCWWWVNLSASLFTSKDRPAGSSGKPAWSEAGTHACHQQQVPMEGDVPTNLHSCRLCIYAQHRGQGRGGDWGSALHIFLWHEAVFLGTLRSPGWSALNGYLMNPQPALSIGRTALACWWSVKSNQSSKQWNDAYRGIHRVVCLAHLSEKLDHVILVLLPPTALSPFCFSHGTLSPAVRQNFDHRNLKL